MNRAQTPGRSDEGFARACRLTNSGQFRRVFAEPKKIGTTGFVVLYRPNGLQTARLGLAIAKKCARRSVDRSRLKRIARESFRANRQALPGVDIVILCSRGALTSPNRRLFEALGHAWATIRKSPCVESRSG